MAPPSTPPGPAASTPSSLPSRHAPPLLPAKENTYPTIDRKDGRPAHPPRHQAPRPRPDLRTHRLRRGPHTNPPPPSSPSLTPSRSPPPAAPPTPASAPASPATHPAPPPPPPPPPPRPPPSTPPTPASPRPTSRHPPPPTRCANAASAAPRLPPPTARTTPGSAARPTSCAGSRPRTRAC